MFLTFYSSRNKYSFNNGSDLWLKSTSLGDRPDAGGIGTKTNSAPNCSLVRVGVESEIYSFSCEDVL